MPAATTTPPLDPVRGRHRRRRPLAAVAIGVLALLLVVVAVWVSRPSDGPTTPAPPDGEATMSADWQGSMVLVTGDGLAASESVDVTARSAGGSASAFLITDDVGAFAVAFRPPAGVDHEVVVSAVSSSGVRLQDDVETTPAEDPVPAPADGDVLVVPMTGAPRVAEPAAASGLPRSTVPSDIPADCSTDVTRALNDWLDGVPDGSEVVFPERACYRVDGSLQLADRADLVISGNGSTFRAGKKVPTPETNRAQWRLDYGGRIVLRDMTLIGMNEKPEFDKDNEFDHNVFIRGSKGVTIDNVHGRGAYGDYIAIAHGVDGRTIPADITISNSSAETVGRMAISCVACDGVTVENSVFNDVGYHVFDLEVEADGWPTRGIRYAGNTVGRHGFAFFSVGTPFQTYRNDVSDIAVLDNLVTQPGANEGECVPAISFLYNKVPARNVVIRGNSLVSRTDAITVQRVTGVVIRDNTATLVGPTCGDPVGIRTLATDREDVGGNDLRGYE